MNLPTLRQIATFFLAIASAVGVYLVCVAAWQTVKGWPLYAAVSGVGLCLLCTTLLQRLKRLHLPHGWDFPPKLAAVCLLGGVGIHWTATAVEHWLIELLHHQYGLLAVVGLVLAAASAMLAYSYRRKLITTTIRRLNKTQERRPHLLWLLSKTGGTVMEVPGKNGEKNWMLIREIKDCNGKTEKQEVMLPVKDGLEELNGVLDGLKPWWNGQQLIRALRHQFKDGQRSLTDLWVVASSGPGGSSSERIGVLRMLRALPEMKDVVIHPDPAQGHSDKWLLDFEDMDALQTGIKEIVDLTGGGKSITIDCTGGQKTTSMASAIATTNNDALIQYVQTASPYDGITFNCELQPEGHPAGHV